MARGRSFLWMAGLLGIGLYLFVYRAVGAASQPIAGEPPPRVAATSSNFEATQHRPRSPVLTDVSMQGSRTADPVPKDPRTDPEARAEAERQRHAYIAGVEAAYRKEPVDPRWASATSTALHTALSASDPLSPLAREVECRSRSCRVVIADDGAGTLNKQLPMFAQQVGRELPSMVADRVVEPGGATSMVLYMARGDDAPAKTP